MAGLTDYSFTSYWRVDAEPAEAFAVLEDVETYPSWWPEVRHAERITESRGRLRCRSLLPYDLVFEIEQKVRDAAAGVLEASMTGDLEGFSRWSIRGTQGGSLLRFDEQVITNKRALNLLAPIARPAFKANHTLMMRHGEAGLRTYLAGLRAGRRLPPAP